MPRRIASRSIRRVNSDFVSSARRDGLYALIADCQGSQAPVSVCDGLSELQCDGATGIVSEPTLPELSSTTITRSVVAFGLGATA